jgi:glyoxylase I family protein
MRPGLERLRRGARASAIGAAYDMMQILGLDHLVLRVHDMARMVRFYTEVIGCEVERRIDSIGLVQLRAGQSLIDLLPRVAPGQDASGVHAANEATGGDADLAARNLDHYCLRVEPFDHSALMAHFINHGIVPGEPRTRYGADGYGPSIYISDPEGNVIELKGPPA